MQRVRPTGLAGTIEDLTDQRQAERDLADSERRYQALVDQLPAIVYTAEAGEAGRWRFVSHQIETTLGYTPRQWMDDPSLWFERLHPDDREGVVAKALRWRSEAGWNWSTGSTRSMTASSGYATRL